MVTRVTVHGGNGHLKKEIVRDRDSEDGFVEMTTEDPDE